MASITRRLLLQSRQCPTRIRARAAPKHTTTQWQRPMSTTPRRCANTPTKEGSPTALDTKAGTELLDELTPELPDSALSPTALADMTPEEREAAILSSLQASLSQMEPDSVADATRKGRAGLPFASELGGIDEDFDIEEDDRKKIAAGFWAEGEESMGPDEDYYGDDLTSLGHAQLEQHRRLREYSRLIAWELPLLSHLAQPFEKPTESTPFRFRYTSYLGESHPAANKVVVEFSPPDLVKSHSLTPVQVSKLIKLAGPRYNPTSQIVKMSCESYDTQTQNKRFLGDSIQSLINEVKNGKDTFEDVPFDFRHHTPKKFAAFPKEWVLTAERKKYLESKREEVMRLEDQKLHNGEMVDGKKVIETSMPMLQQAAQMQAETVMAGGARGKPLR